MSKSAPGVRYAEIYRETAETRIQIVLDLDGGTRRDITTGIGFFDHMLEQMAFHGNFDVGINAEGDLHIDDHHTVEDVGIVMGKAIQQALDATDSIERFGDCATPMDDALVLVAIDLSGRGQLVWDLDFTRESIGDLSCETIREFFRALAINGRFNLHVKKLAGINDHHVAEALFKGFGRTLNIATTRTERRGAISTKGKTS